MVAKDAPGMKGSRSRNKDGQLRQKRADTQAGTLEKKYGVDLGVRSDAQLGTIRKRTGETGLKDILDGK